MNINNVGYNHCHNADFQVQRPQGSGDYLLVLLKTDAIFTFHGKNCTAEANSFILFEKDTPQNYQASGTHFLNDWFHFTISEEEMEFFRELDIPFNKIIPVDDISTLSLLIKNMCHEHYSSNRYKADSAELYLKLFFMKLSEKIHSDENQNTGSYYDKMSILRSKIYSMPHHNWRVDKLANSLTMSKSYFEHLYKKIFGISVMNDVIQSRMEHSKYLLSTTDIPIIKIAEICGYNNAPHFMRQFKSRMDMTPTQYRESAKK